jgi:hypothetical protein
MIKMIENTSWCGSSLKWWGWLKRLVDIHHEKLCSQKLQHLAIRCSRQLICNYVTTIQWKHEELKIKCHINFSWSFIIVAC